MKEKIVSLIIALAAVFLVTIGTSAAETGDRIQLAILLDTSNSMDGLIDQAKSQIWKIVNETALAKKNGKVPALEVALYEYGKDSISAGEGHLRMITPLTTDLDRVSEGLFGLTTNGGSEYCGRVIRSAVRGLSWSTGKNDLKILYIAGNEPFTQGDVDYRAACKEAIGRGIVVNTIFCGDSREGVDTRWKDGANLADGTYMAIDQNMEVAYIAAPQDDEISRLGQELNSTYIAYGAAGFEKKSRFEEQDANAAAMSPESSVQRSVAKVSSQYDSSGWDLVDAVKKDKIDVSNVKENELPPVMRKMSPLQRKEYIADTIKKREAIQKKIQKLDTERRKFIEAELKKTTNDGTLDAAVIKSLHDAGAKKGYTFK